jgi:lysophospholipase L1-like esterase
MIQWSRASVLLRIEMPLVVCIGASIVRGLFGVSFVPILTRRMSGDGFRLVNAGVGGQTAGDVLARLEGIIAQQPDYAVILVGTNDVTAALYPRLSRISLARLNRRSPQSPSAESYRENMLQIVKLLKERTAARIALVSLPVLGEDLGSEHNEYVRAYNAILKEIASHEDVAYIPAHEAQERYLKSGRPEGGVPFEPGRMLSLKLLWRHYVLRQSLDEISSRNGYLLLTDGMHLNSRGATNIADQVEAFLRGHADGAMSAEGGHPGWKG